jgi:hypothetical protein
MIRFAFDQSFGTDCQTEQYIHRILFVNGLKGLKRTTYSPGAKVNEQRFSISQDDIKCSMPTSTDGSSPSFIPTSGGNVANVPCAFEQSFPFES